MRRFGFGEMISSGDTTVAGGGDSGAPIFKGRRDGASVIRGGAWTSSVESMDSTSEGWISSQRSLDACYNCTGNFQKRLAKNKTAAGRLPSRYRLSDRCPAWGHCDSVPHGFYLCTGGYDRRVHGVVGCRHQARSKRREPRCEEYARSQGKGRGVEAFL